MKKGILEECQNLNEIKILQKRFEVLPIGDLDFADIFKDIVEYPIKKISEVLEYKQQGHTLSIVGRIESIQPKITKKGSKMAFITFMNQNKKIRVTVWPSDWDVLSTQIKTNQFAQIWGDVGIWNENVSLVMKKINLF